MKSTLILTGSLLTLLVASPLLAEDRGDRINERLDQRSDRLEAHGHEKAAAHLDRKGDRVENRLDRRVDRRHGGDR